MLCSPVRVRRASGRGLWAGRERLDRHARVGYVRNMGGEERVSPRASRRAHEEGERDARRAWGYGEEAEEESAARAAGGVARDECGARVRTAGRARWAGRAWGPWVRTWGPWVRTWGPWIRTWGPWIRTWGPWIRTWGPWVRAWGPWV